MGHICRRYKHPTCIWRVLVWEQVEAVAAVKTHLLFVTGGEMNAKIGRHLVTCPRIVMKVNDVLLRRGPVCSPQRFQDPSRAPARFFIPVNGDPLPQHGMSIRSFKCKHLSQGSQLPIRRHRRTCRSRHKAALRADFISGNERLLQFISRHITQF